MYSQTAYGPGNIAALTSGAALNYGPTIGSNDPASAMSAGGSFGSRNIPALSGCGGCGRHAPVPMHGIGAEWAAMSTSTKWFVVGLGALAAWIILKR
jgi:hypothetical protein